MPSTPSGRSIDLIASQYRINRLAVMDGDNLIHELPCRLKLDTAYNGEQPDAIVFLNMPDFLSIDIKDLADLAAATSSASLIANSRS
jgi:hypothetical protein